MDYIYSEMEGRKAYINLNCVSYFTVDGKNRVKFIFENGDNLECDLNESELRELLIKVKI